LHYNSPEVRELVERMIALTGSADLVCHLADGRAFVVPKHYIALHGVRAEELPYLGFVEVTEPNGNGHR